jgi:hypothetical protein
MPPRLSEIRPADRIHDLAVVLARAVNRVRREPVADRDELAEESPTSRLELSVPSPLSVDTRGLTPPGNGDLR